MTFTVAEAKASIGLKVAVDIATAWPNGGLAKRNLHHSNRARAVRGTITGVDVKTLDGKNTTCARVAFDDRDIADVEALWFRPATIFGTWEEHEQLTREMASAGDLHARAARVSLLLGPAYNAWTVGDRIMVVAAVEAAERTAYLAVQSLRALERGNQHVAKRHLTALLDGDTPRADVERVLAEVA